MRGCWKAPRARRGAGFRHKSAIGGALLGAAALLGATPAAADTARIAIPGAIPQAALPDEPAVFGTVPVPVKATPLGTRWSRVMRASLDQPALHRLARGAAGLPATGKAAYVQAAVNRAVRNSAASYNCADDGYWAAGGETLGRGVGDCIDIVIAKMEALRLLGVPARDLYLATGYVGGRKGGRESAALLVRTGDQFWLLTDRTDRVLAANGEGSAEFAPVVTYGVGKSWVHGKLMRSAPPRAAVTAAVTSAAAPAAFATSPSRGPAPQAR